MLNQALATINSRMYVKELFDPIQTHAVYAVNEEDVDEVKALLKEQFKATRFRIVNPRISGMRIVCFKINKKVKKGVAL